MSCEIETAGRDKEWPYRVVGVDGVEVAGRFKTKDAAKRQAIGMNQLRENWDPSSNKRCRPPYRAQEIGWVDVP